MIHPTAIIATSARIEDNVSIGPYSIIGENVEIGAGCVIDSHVSIKGPTRIGKDNKFHPFTSIGDDPQDKKFSGEHTWLEIGDRNLFREHATVNRGTGEGGGVTRIGDGNWIMTGAHVAHDCTVGNNTIFSNNASIAGHVTVGDNTILGGFTLVHQFCVLGEFCFTALGCVVTQDIPPYVLASGNKAKPYGLNSEGLKRNNFDDETIKLLRKGYRLIYKSRLPINDALAELQQLAYNNTEVTKFMNAIKHSIRGIIR